MDFFEHLVANPVLRAAIGLRRALRGPRLPAWSLELEIACEFMRLYAPISKRMSAQNMRRGAELVMSHPPLRDDVRREKGRVLSCAAEWFVPERIEHDAVIYYLHGGGYVLGSIQTHQALISNLCVAAGARALAIDYRLAPEHPLPAALDDALAGYRYLLAQGIAPGRIVLMGDSAGGGLCMSLLLRLRALGVVLPAAAVLLSPWVDLEASGESLRHYEFCDYITRDYLLRCADWALGAEMTNHPLFSTIHADLSGLPPVLVQCGGAEGLLDDAIHLVARAREAGVPVMLDVQPDMVHVYQLFASFAPEARRALETAAAFVRDHAGMARGFAAVAQ
jgi:monoterpene epsilon-lactone hydrolase